MAKPFNGYMREIPKALAEKTTKAIDHAPRAIRSGSEEDYDAAAKELSQIQQDTFQETGEAARNELKERLMSLIRAQGGSTDDAEFFAESKAKELWDKAEKLRTVAVRLKAVAVVAAIAVLAAITYISSITPPAPKPMPAPTTQMEPTGDKTASPDAETQHSTDLPPKEETSQGVSASDGPSPPEPVASSGGQGQSSDYGTYVSPPSNSPVNLRPTIPYMPSPKIVETPLPVAVAPPDPAPIALPSPYVQATSPEPAPPAQVDNHNSPPALQTCGPAPQNPLYACSSGSSECSKLITTYSNWCRCNGYAGGLNTSTGACQH